MKHIPKKSLGQNFLKSESIIEKIKLAAELAPNDTVLEIGPGLGALTKTLLDSANTVVSVEKDNDLYDYLKKTFSGEIHSGKFSVINGDILHFDPLLLEPYCKNRSNGYKLVANIPYNITGAIIEKFLSTSFQPKTMVLMVQKEVAERIIAKDKKTGGKGKESILSIAVKAYSDPEYVCTVKAGNFNPVPKVDSAVIAVRNISRSKFKNAHHEQVFFQVVKAGFAHKRKTLAGNLKNILEPELVARLFEELNLPPLVRAEDLGINDWYSLAEIVYNDQYGK